MIGEILIFVFVSLLYFVVIRPCSYWARKNVPTVGTIIPLVGDTLQMFLGNETYTDMVTRKYNELQNSRYIGIYLFQIPALLIRTPEIIKQICVKDAESFIDHGSLVLQSGDDLWVKSLFPLRGQEWKDARAFVSPTLSLTKLKLMFPLLCEHFDSLVKFYQEKNQAVYELEFKDAFTRILTDIVASTAMGIKVDSFRDPDNEVYRMSFDACDLATPWKKFALFIFQTFPTIANFFKLSIFHQDVKSYFTNLVMEAIKLRKKHNIQRNDMLGIFMEVREEQEKLKKEFEITGIERADNKIIKHQLTDIDISAHVFVTFLGFIDSGSTSLCFMAYELAVNPDVQQKLIKEIDENRPESGLPSYDTIMNLPYMEMVMNESLRKWPGATATDRVVTKPYILKPELPNEKPVRLELDDNILIPIFSIHRDPKYYENPEKFDPERFSPENKKKINPYTYIPFGVGPRFCVGTRFSYMTIKTLFFYLLSHFEIVPTENTQIPLRLCKKALSPFSENGFPLGLKRRR